jgi:nicotinate phosphoribosyltransferase
MQTLGLLADPGRYGLATDLYQLTMAAAYFASGTGQGTATFELFVRRLPAERGYLLTAGLEQAVEYLQGLRFSGESLDYLRSQPVFAHTPVGFWEYLRDFRFTGDVNALPEGTVAFPNEPLFQVTAPLIQAQMVETFLLATLNHQTLIATKAARVVDAAAGKGVVDFGVRRAHGFEAGTFGARAAYIGGCIGTSNVLAGQAFGIPIYGTAAHSFIMAFPHESDAFRAYQQAFPASSILLIDTYDTLEGARRVAALEGPIRGVRLDSGDLLELSRGVREILDAAGRQETIISASGDLNEDSIAKLVAARAPIDLYGVGTDLQTSRDAPALSGVYKLVAIQENGHRRPVRKLSQEKASYPDIKQIYRQRDATGKLSGDTLALREETLAGEPLLVPVLRGGELAAPLPSLETIRARAAEQRDQLPEEIRRLHGATPYPVSLSEGLQREMATLHPEL